MKNTSWRLIAFLSLALAARSAVLGAQTGFNGIGVNMGNLFRLSDAKTRSISPENFTGEKGKAAMSTDGPAKNAARDLGQGWKVSPYVHLKPKSTFTMAEIEGPGAIQHI